MRPERALRVLLLAALVALAGCRAMDRLTFIRPSAERGAYTKVAPTYDVGGKPGRRDEDPVLLLQNAGDAFRLGDLARAQRLAEQARKAGADGNDVATLLGAIADARGDHAAAGRYYKAAAGAVPDNGIYANNYGTWLCANGQPGEALGWFERAVADPTYPTPAVALANAGDCALQAGQPTRAEASWRLALAADPRNLAALAGMARLEAGRDRLLEARAFLERWLELAPQDAEALRLAATVESRLGDNAAASRYLSRLNALPPAAPVPPRNP